MKSIWRRAVRIGGVLFILICISLLVIFILGETDKAVIVTFIKNENLPTINPAWKGNPVDQKNRFVNEEIPFLPKTIDLLKWQLGGNPQREEKQTDSARLEIKDPTDFFDNEKDGILWLGHAGFFYTAKRGKYYCRPGFWQTAFCKNFCRCFLTAG